MITSSRVLRFHDKHDCRLDTLTMDPLRADEIQCKAVYSAISLGTEVISYQRDFPPSMHRYSELGAPTQFGYSMAAEVIAVGADVTDYQVGDRIYVWQKHREFFNVVPGAMADPSPGREPWRYVVAKVPDNVGMIEASFMTVIRCSLFAAMKAEVGFTDTVVIAGLGAFGLFALQFVKMMGARRVIAIDPIAERTDRARELGADIVFTADAADVINDVIAANEGRGVDSVIDATNSYKLISAGSEMLRGDGKLVIIGDPIRADLMLYPDRARRAYIDIRGIWIDMMTSDYPQPFYPVTIEDVHTRIFELIASRKLVVRDLVTEIVSPADADDFYRRKTEDSRGTIAAVYDWSLLQ